MDFNLEVRLKQLEDLDQFLSVSSTKVQRVIDKLGWTTEAVLKDVKLITCSLDTSHKVPQNSIDQHIKKCTLRKEGYDLNEAFLSEPVGSTTSSILIDDHKKIEILSEARKNRAGFKSAWNGQDPDPRTADRLASTFSTDERLALYEFAVRNTVRPPVIPDFDIANSRNSHDKPLTYEERLAQDRDAKRRRVKYKTVHTSRKNHKEVLREVIESQMDLYKDWLNDGAQDVSGTTNHRPIKEEVLTEDDERPVADYPREVKRACSTMSSRSGSPRSIQRKHRYADYNGRYTERDQEKSKSRKRSCDRDSESSYDRGYYHDRDNSKTKHSRYDERHKKYNGRSGEHSKYRERSPHKHSRNDNDRKYDSKQYYGRKR